MRIWRDHELGLAEARNRIDRVTAELEKRFSLRSSWDGDHVVVRGNDVNGRIVIAHNYVEAHIRLGLTLILFERQIRSGISAAMDEHLR
jgi:putative polyhydroxyalkanoate system protein